MRELWLTLLAWLKGEGSLVILYPAKRQAEITILFEEFGVGNIMVAQGKAHGKFSWSIRFEWRGAAYRFTFTPLECKVPDKVATFSGERRMHAEQACYQVRRIATHFVKAILTAAEAPPAAFFGFVELPEAGLHPGGLPFTIVELDVSGLVGMLPELVVRVPYLTDGAQ